MKAKRPLAPGQVWWCDGAALGFEAHFKTRPVLVVAETEENGGGWLVMPLSSKRRYGQEPQVKHGGKTSYMTGQRATISSSALLSYSGDWENFPDWRDGTTNKTPLSFWEWLRRLFRRS